jgi:hypothetical protein
VYEGEYKGGAMEGFGTYQYVDGRAEVGRYQGNVDVGEGVRWSADRTTAWRLNDGKVVEEISLDTADRIARKIGKTRISDSMGMPSQSTGYKPSVASGSSRRPASGGKSASGLHNSFAAPNVGASSVAAPTRSSRNSNGSSRHGSAGSNRSTASYKGTFGNSAAARNPHSVVHGSHPRHNPPGSAASRAALGPGARNPLGGVAGQRPLGGVASQRPLGGVAGQRRAASAGQFGRPYAGGNTHQQ